MRTITCSFLLLLTTIWSCQPDGNTSTDIANLALSDDTVMFDTVFTSIGSATEIFKVFNRGNDPLLLDEIAVARGEASIFRINFDGVPGISFSDVSIPPNDSLYFFVEVTVDPTQGNLPFIVKDSIIFKTVDAQEDIKLIAWGQNAHFHRNDSIVTNTVWRDDKPHVIFGDLHIADGATLTILPNTQVHGHAWSRINVWRRSKLSAIGTQDDPIVFQGDRLEQYYQDQPGQWIGIRVRPGAEEARFRYVTIKNGFIGLQVDSMVNANALPNVFLENSTITTMNLWGILCNNASIQVVSSEITNICGYLFEARFGGYYNLAFSTFGGLQKSCTRGHGAFRVANNDFTTAEGDVLANELQLVVRNSIIYGGEDEELEYDVTGQGEVLAFIFDHSILKTERTDDFNINDNILNRDPKWVNPGNLNFQLDTLSPATGNAVPIEGVIFDRLGQVRDSENPDIGAFERDE